MFTRATLTARERMVKRSIPCIDAEAPCGPEKQKARNLWGAGLIPQEGRGRDRYLLKKRCDT
jgi:hypothetical protein